MTWFTDSPFEKMMTQKPGHGRHGDDTPPVPRLVLAALTTRGYPLVLVTVSNNFNLIEIDLYVKPILHISYLSFFAKKLRLSYRNDIIISVKVGKVQRRNCKWLIKVN